MGYWSIRPFWYWLLPILYTCIGKILCYKYFGVLISFFCSKPFFYFAKNYILRKFGKPWFSQKKTMPLLGNF